MWGKGTTFARTLWNLNVAPRETDGTHESKIEFLLCVPINELHRKCGKTSDCILHT